jgi:hypothetical protein
LHFQLAITHCFAASLNLPLLSVERASEYTRTTGSVPERR